MSIKRKHKKKKLASSDPEVQWWAKQQHPKLIRKRKQHREKLQYFVAKLRNLDCPVDSIVDELIKWYTQPPMPKFGYETFAALVRDALEVNVDGKNVNNINQWEYIIPRIEKIQEIFEDRGTLFGRIIISESLAHRYVDLFLHTKDSKYRQKAEEYYLHSFALSKKNKQFKNIDSSLIHLGKAYLKFGETQAARKTFRKLLKRKGRRYDHPKQNAYLVEIRAMTWK